MNTNTRTRARIALAAMAATGALLLAACGDDDGGSAGAHHDSAPSASASASPSQSARFNDADVTFAQAMIPHHEQALDMAALADGRAEDPEVKALAEQIRKAQDPEIRTMTGWLKAWGKPVEGGGHAGHEGMDGMMSDTQMDELEAAEGTAFDKAFAEMMIEHHEGAIAMAEDEKENGENPAAKKLAQAVIDGQSAEVEQLKAIVARL